MTEYSLAEFDLRGLLIRLEADWGTRPHVVLACAGGSDEHWQIRRDPNSELADAILA